MARQVKQKKETPLMKQFAKIKAAHPGTILLFRVGDFYETFGSDAVEAADILGITLTKRANGSASHIELAGFPHHSLDTYLPKLVRYGKRVAVCDQLEDPKMAKGIVKRGVTELVTPGVSLNDSVLERKKNNYLASVHLEGSKTGLALADISTGQFMITEGSGEYISTIIQSLQPAEILFQKGLKQSVEGQIGEFKSHYQLDDWIYSYDYARDILLDHFKTNSLKGFGVEKMQSAQIAAGACMHYLRESRQGKLNHINKIVKIERGEFLWMDPFTVRNLELVNPLNEGGKSLFSILDNCSTSMGSRLLRNWILFPLRDKKRIDNRLGIVGELLNSEEYRLYLESELKEIGDFERLVAKIATGRVNPRECVHLKTALKGIDRILDLSHSAQNIDSTKELVFDLDPLSDLHLKLAAELRDEAPAVPGKRPIFKEGVNKELDEYRTLSEDGSKLLDEMLEREVRSTHIPSLKIAFNSVFGYYIEVRNTHKDKVPDEWVRKQTLVNAERYITEELKEYEEKIRSAEDRIKSIEFKMYEELVEHLQEKVRILVSNSEILSKLDVLSCFAFNAQDYDYNKPEINEKKALQIDDGRHPVIEQSLIDDEEYIPNSVFLDCDTQQIVIITGPNMSGKSALLRQTALIVLMTQIGSYIPASKAVIGIADKIFTRVGASDNLSRGESTFMVEMNETASILNNITDRSLVLLDEIGRGTSTYDGVSLAWAITEYLHECPLGRPKVLFATHYHELNELEGNFERIKNYNVAVKEKGSRIIFLRKLMPGGTSHSYGIHVAKLAGMPAPVLQRAKQILKLLEDSREDVGEEKRIDPLKLADQQLSIFQSDSPVFLKIREFLDQTDVNTLTPIDALFKLNQLKELLKEQNG